MGREEDDDRNNRNYNHYDLNNKVMLTAIISLSVVVILVSVLHIYARCVLRRQARRRAALRDSNFITNASQIHSLVPPRSGLDPLVIASLPLFVFKKSDGNDSAAELESFECAVCLSVLQEGELARTLPNCKHTFHGECVDKWFGQHSTCPICRTEAEPLPSPLVPEPREGVALPTAPPLERVNSVSTNMGDTSDQGGNQQSSVAAKIGGSSSRLSRSFRRILSRERSFQRLHSCGQEDGVLDLERQQ